MAKDINKTLQTLETLHSLIAGGGDDSNYTSQQKQWIAKLYKTETGEALKECNCKNRYTDAVLLLYARLKHRGALAEELQYKLRPGIVIWLDNDCYTSVNITDEIAKRWLEQHPDGIKYFNKA